MTIIAAVDFSKISSNVARIAAGLARKLRDDLLLVHVVEPSTSLYDETRSLPLPMPTKETTLLLETGEESLRRLRAELGFADLKIETRVVVGTPDFVLEEVAKETKARLIVAGTHGRGAVERLLVGSVSQRLILRAPCAVLVIRHGQGESLERWISGEGSLRVVAGIDQKGQATEATLEWLRQLGEVGPSEVTLVHEYWPPAEYTRLGMRGPRDLFETDPEVAKILERELEATVGALALAPNTRLRARASWGPIGEALAREATATSAALVVVGSEQPHGWQRLKRGSVALSALHAVSVPLLCTPVGARRSDQTPGVERPVLAPALRSILVATDLSPESSIAIGHAYSLLRAQGGVVHLCHVVERALPEPAYLYAADEARLTAPRRAELEERLRGLVPAQAAELEIETRVLVVDGGEAAAQIAAAALQRGVDAIVLSSHGRSGLKRAVLGSVAEAVLRRAETPVYVVRSGPSV